MIELQFYRRRLLLLFISTKLILFTLAFICSALIEPYNPSIGLILFPKNNPFVSLADYWIKRLLRPFASWDGAYFLTIAMKGYIYEQEHAFFPLYPILIRLFADYLLYPLRDTYSLAARCLLAAVSISNICHYISVFTLYSLSCHLFGDAYFAFLSAAFLVLVPTQAVMSAAYSESLFTCLTISGLSMFYTKKHAQAALLWCLAGATRSNGILLPGFFIYEYLHSLRHMSIFKSILRFFRLLILLAISWTGFFTVLAYAKIIYCECAAPRPWCSSLLPNIYAFVQDHYWNVGFLRYWTLAQLPNFIIAAPMILLSSAGIFSYMRQDIKWSLCLGLTHRQHLLRKRPYYARSLLPHVYLWALMLAYTVLVIHVQIINRLFTFMPIIYWFQAHLYYIAGGQSRRGRRWRTAQIGFIGIFACITSILFFSFYPPA